MSYSSAKGAKKSYVGGDRRLPFFTHRRSDNLMKILTAHKILISSAVVFFVFFAFWEYRNSANGDSWAVWRSGLYLLVALGFGIYLKNLKRWYR